MGRRERMVETALGIANDDSHGYSQYRRWPWQGSDFDCSSLMYWCANQAGYDVPTSGYTGTMLADFTAAGFTADAWDGNIWDCEPGDILLAHNGNRQHTEMYVGNGCNVGAHVASNGDIDDGMPGDQNGNEISVAQNWGSWDYVLTPPDDGDAPEPSPEPEGVRYCASTDPSGAAWLDEMVGTHDTGGSEDTWAGELGSAIYFIAANCKLRVMTAASFPEWLPWVDKYDKSDLDYGCAGDGTEILLVQAGGHYVDVHRMGEWNGVVDGVTIR